MKPAELRLEFCSALLGTGLVQPVDSDLEKSTKRVTLWALCRQVPGGEKSWIALIDQMLVAGGTYLHLCRRYVRRNEKLTFGWYLAVSAPAKELEAPIRVLLDVLRNAKPELTPIPPPAPAAAPRQAPRLARQEPAGEDFDSEALPDVGRLAEGAPAVVGAAPPGFNPNPRVVLRTRDPETGRLHIETEMPLPHVYKEMNRPNAKGRGARAYTGRRPT